jgi:2-(1,2-epoxy-1,2-dihydrophenyl)acetyl-CoA isomerase
VSAQPGIEVTTDDYVRTIRINRPEAHNAVTPDQVNYISRQCGEAENDDDVRVVVMTGTGDSFCAGADLRGVDLSATGGQIPPVGMGGNVFLPILELSKPLIGGINGVAAGGGLGLALCCDFRIGSENARFATAFSRIGITTNDAVAWLLPRIVGYPKALELIYSGRPIGAEEALRIGVMSYLVPGDELDAQVQERARAIAQGPPMGIRFSKRLVMDGLTRTYREHVLAQEYASLANRTVANDDIQEGIAAFKEKRPPRFRGMTIERRWENY